LDLQDELASRKALFHLPKGGVYLDGNSLGPLPIAAAKRAQEVVLNQWGEDLICSWNRHAWIDLPSRVGEKIAPLLGAKAGQTICCDSISVNLFKLLCAALKLQTGRSVVLSSSDNFPTDLYTVQGLTGLLGETNCQLKLVDCQDNAEERILAQIDDSIAVVMLTQVNFRTGRVLDVERITKAAHQHGCLVIWDLAHSTGALPLELDKWNVDFAVGCGYKFLNGGPGAPAYIYVNQRWQKAFRQPLSGWMGHASPFDFSIEYTPASGVAQALSGTPAVISMSVLDAALSVYEGIDMLAVRRKSMGLGQVFVQLLQHFDLDQEFKLESPADAKMRGSQLSLSHQYAYEICQALIDQGIVADFRAPNILRFGFSALYTGFADLYDSMSILATIVEQKSYFSERFQRGNTKVT
jgi:kynureninase